MTQISTTLRYTVHMDKGSSIRRRLFLASLVCLTIFRHIGKRIARHTKVKPSHVYLKYRAINENINNARKSNAHRPALAASLPDVIWVVDEKKVRGAHLCWDRT